MTIEEFWDQIETDSVEVTTEGLDRLRDELVPALISTNDEDMLHLAILLAHALNEVEMFRSVESLQDAEDPVVS